MFTHAPRTPNKSLSRSINFYQIVEKQKHMDRRDHQNITKRNKDGGKKLRVEEKNLGINIQFSKQRHHRQKYKM